MRGPDPRWLDTGIKIIKILVNSFYAYKPTKGGPVRLELGPKDLAKNETRAVRRDNGQPSQLSALVSNESEEMENSEAFSRETE